MSAQGTTVETPETQEAPKTETPSTEQPVAQEATEKPQEEETAAPEALPSAELAPEAKKKKIWCVVFWIFVGVAVLSLLGVTNTLLDMALYEGNREFLKNSSNSSTILFVSFSIIKIALAALRDVPVLGGAVDAVKDLVDYAWWGCFLSMVVLQVLKYFFEFVAWCGRAPAVIFSAVGCLLAFLQWKGWNWTPVRKVLIATFALLVGLYLIAPLATFGVAKVVGVMEEKQIESFDAARKGLEKAQNSIPDYSTYYGAKLSNFFSGIGGKSDEDFADIKKGFEKSEVAFKENCESALKGLFSTVVLYLAQKAIACFLFPFAFIFAVHFSLKKGCAWLDVPYKLSMKKIFTPPEATRTDALNKAMKERIVEPIKKRRAEKKGTLAEEQPSQKELPPTQKPATPQPPAEKAPEGEKAMEQPAN